ncbi:unnamed protein product, partial [Rotaria magnacalcarata]
MGSSSDITAVDLAPSTPDTQT